MTIQLTREFFVPPGAVKVRDKASSAVVYAYDRNGQPYAVAFHGKAAKPAFHFRFRDTEAREKRVRKFFAEVQGVENYKAERKAKRREKLAQPHKLQVGHILVSSWGYEQTNIDWYQVTALKGARSVELRKIGAVIDTDLMDQGTCTPRLDDFRGEAFTKRVDEHNGVKLESYAWARLWDGKPMRWSSYH